MDAFDKELLEVAGQRSDVWFDARLGKFTASEIHKLIGKGRAKEAVFTDTGYKYILVKVAEELTGFAHQTPYSAALEYGQDMEPVARLAYEKLTGETVTDATFVDFKGIAGGTPDGYLSGNRIIEFKCPINTDNHIAHMRMLDAADLKDEKPEYYWQCQANLLFTGAKKCLFVSFDPRMKREEHKIKTIHVMEDLDDQKLLVERIALAVEEKQNILNSLYSF